MEKQTFFEFSVIHDKEYIDKPERKKWFINDQVIYMPGKYINTHNYYEKNNYADVIFEDDVIYKTWWHDSNDWYSTDSTLSYVEESSEEEEKMYKKLIKEKEDQVLELNKEIAKIRTERAIPKIYKNL